MFHFLYFYKKVIFSLLLFYAFLCNFYFIFFSFLGDQTTHSIDLSEKKRKSRVCAEYSNYREQCYFVLEFFITVTTFETLMITRNLKYTFKIHGFFLSTTYHHKNIFTVHATFTVSTSPSITIIYGFFFCYFAYKSVLVLYLYREEDIHIHR